MNIFIFRHDHDLSVIQCITNILVNKTDSGKSLRPEIQMFIEMSLILNKRDGLRPPQLWGS